MGQIGAKVYQKACIYDHSVNGDVTNAGKGMGMSIIGGDSIISIFYTVLSPIVIVGAATDIQAGWGWNSYQDMIDPTHNAAFLNAHIGYWLTYQYPTPGVVSFPKEPIGNTLNNQIGICTANDPGTITAGKMLFSFTLMSHAL
jgi:hypothetical protein